MDFIENDQDKMLCFDIRTQTTFTQWKCGYIFWFCILSNIDICVCPSIWTTLSWLLSLYNKPPYQVEWQSCLLTLKASVSWLSLLFPLTGLFCSGHCPSHLLWAHLNSWLPAWAVDPQPAYQTNCSIKIDSIFFLFCETLLGSHCSSLQSSKWLFFPSWIPWTLSVSFTGALKC